VVERSGVADAEDRDPYAWTLPLGQDVPVELVPTAALVLSGSPRLNGENAEHTRLLAESTVRLPPIVVHRASMRVIDGMHRTRAAAIRGQQLIEVQFFEGTEDGAFLLSVKANITHGLPLSRADRRAAAGRMMDRHPNWSDRAIAAATGLAAATVSALRRKVGSTATAIDRRLGLDGRVRPLDRTAGRRAAGEIIARCPDASLREIARAAGISTATARDVRRRVRQGEPAVPADARAGGRGTGRPARTVPAGGDTDRATLIAGLRNDPSLRFTETGRAFLRWLLERAPGPSGWSQVVPTIPPHCMYVLATVARQCAEEWLELAEHLDRQLAAEE
jgi:ParB-like chromosome segregation protein Spo0J